MYFENRNEICMAIGIWSGKRFIKKAFYCQNSYYHMEHNSLVEFDQANNGGQTV